MNEQISAASRVTTTVDPLHPDYADLRIRLAEPEVEDDAIDPMNHVHADLRIKLA